MTKKPRPQPGHNWWFKGASKLYKVLSKAKPGRKRIPVLVTEEDPLNALKHGGQGHTDICAGAFCAKRNAHLFPHNMTGYVDIWPTRAFFSSKNNKYDHPAEHYEYALGGRDAALMWQWNDSRGGLQKMLEYIRKNGPLQVSFNPLPPRRINQADSGAPEGKYDNSRIGGGKKPKGHKRRHAVKERGSYEAAVASFRSASK